MQRKLEKIFSIKVNEVNWGRLGDNLSHSIAYIHGFLHPFDHNKFIQIMHILAITKNYFIK